MSLLTEGGLLVIALVGFWLVGPPISTIVAINFVDFLWGILAGLGLLAIVLLAIDTRLGEGSRMRQDIDRLIPVFENVRFIDLVLIAALAGAGEEAVFRGVLFFHLDLWWGTVVAVLITSTLFGLVHPLSISYFTFTMIIGVIMASLFLVTDNLLVPMVAHGIYDLAALIYVKYFRKQWMGVAYE